MSGWQVAEAVRELISDVPVIYTSGNAADPKRQVSGSLFFGKPYDPEAVIEACGSLVASPMKIERLRAFNNSFLAVLR